MLPVSWPSSAAATRCRWSRPCWSVGWPTEPPVGGRRATRSRECSTAWSSPRSCATPGRRPRPERPVPLFDAAAGPAGPREVYAGVRDQLRLPRSVADAEDQRAPDRGAGRKPRAAGPVPGAAFRSDRRAAGADARGPHPPLLPQPRPADVRAVPLAAGRSSSPTTTCASDPRTCSPSTMAEPADLPGGAGRVVRRLAAASPTQTPSSTSTCPGRTAGRRRRGRGTRWPSSGFGAVAAAACAGWRSR